jgi:choline dehydrogenase-like flavoprotein
LLRSKPFLPFLSEHVGRNIAYNGSVKAAAVLPEGFPDGDMFTGRTHPGMVSYEFLASHRITVHAVKALPLMLVSAAHLGPAGRSPISGWWGAPHGDLMRELRYRVIILDAFGLTPPGGRLDLVDADTLALSLPVDLALEQYHRQTRQLLESILVRNGCRLIRADFLDKSLQPKEGIHFSTAHQVGSCRMADAKTNGVVDAYGEVFDYPGLYVSDGAAIPSSLAVNTSLTILANAERIADRIAERYRLRAAA